MLALSGATVAACATIGVSTVAAANVAKIIFFMIISSKRARHAPALQRLMTESL
jgi:hypothetical protein